MALAIGAARFHAPRDAEDSGMQLTIHVPDDLIAAVRDQLPPPETGVLEAVALDAILGFLGRLRAPEADAAEEG